MNVRPYNRPESLSKGPKTKRGAPQSGTPRLSKCFPTAAGPSNSIGFTDFRSATGSEKTATPATGVTAPK